MNFKSSVFKLNFLPKRLACAFVFLSGAAMAWADAAAPIFTPDAGFAEVAFNVVVTCTTGGATIHYTTNGIDPVQTDPVIASGSAVWINRTLTLKARAWNGSDVSAVKSADYTVTGGLSVGEYHVMVLKSDRNTIWAWGVNSNGQLGNGTMADSYTPVQVLASASTALSNVIAINCGEVHSLAVKSDGSVWDWGYNGYGGLGNNLTTDLSYPVQVQVLSATTTYLSGVVDAKGGEYDSMALKNDGTVWTWGYNSSGQLGTNNTTAYHRAVQVMTSGSTSLGNIVAIEAGHTHQVGLDANGLVWTWGYNGNGELGNGTTSSRSYAGQISSSALSHVIEISSRYHTNLALRSDHTVWAWGYNSNCQCGQASSNSAIKTPSEILLSDGTTPLSNVIAISAGWSHCAAVTSDGYLWTWGSNGHGEQGVGTHGSQNTQYAHQVMTSASTYLTNVVGLACGSNFTIAVQKDGTLYTWGSGLYGQIGNSSTNLYNFYATAYSSLPCVAYKPPTISLSVSGTLIDSANLNLTASAAAPDGTSGIARIDFYEDGVWIGTATTSPYQFTASNVPQGNHTFSAMVTDTTGGSATSAPVSVLIAPKPTVTIVATSGTAYEYGGVQNVFTVTRSGSDSLNQPLNICYTTDGTAVSGSDYQLLVSGTTLLSGTIQIPAGTASLQVQIAPQNLVEKGDQTVVVNLGTGSCYSPGSSGSATVTVKDNSWDDNDHDGYPNVYETANGSDPNNPASVPTPTCVVDWTGGGDYTTIQDAINNATADYAVIWVNPGNYIGSVNISNHKILLVTGLDGNGSASIDGGSQSSAVFANTNSVLIGFSITNGTGNSTTPNGGGITINQCSPRFINCVISGNQADDGAAICNINGSPIFMNCTIFNNTSATGGSVHCSGTGAVFTNTILWDTGATSEVSGDGASITYSDVFVSGSGSVYAGTGNINANPALNPNGHLVGATSPCIGAGTSNCRYLGLDMDGEIRPNPVTGLIDIGADQFLDSDGDTLPDWWENLNGLDPNDPSDATDDQVTAYQNISSGGTQQ